VLRYLGRKFLGSRFLRHCFVRFLRWFGGLSPFRGLLRNRFARLCAHFGNSPRRFGTCFRTSLLDIGRVLSFLLCNRFLRGGLLLSLFLCDRLLLLFLWHIKVLVRNQTGQWWKTGQRGWQIDA